MNHQECRGDGSLQVGRAIMPSVSSFVSQREAGKFSIVVPRHPDTAETRVFFYGNTSRWRTRGNQPFSTPPSPRGHTINKPIESTLSSLRNSTSQAAFSRMQQITFHTIRQTVPRRFALGASNVCLVGEHPACSVSAMQGY